MNTRPLCNSKKLKTIARQQRRLRRRQREGVVLLVVLTLLALFIVICTTFLVLASTHSKGAVASGRSDQLGDQPEKLLDMAMYQVLRGTRDPNSAIRGHDLLGDIYGTDGFAGIAVAASFPEATAMNPGGSTGRQLMDVDVNANAGFVFNLYGRETRLRSTINYYNGCVFTFVSGPARGYSTRVVGYAPPINGGNTATFRIVTPMNDSNQVVLPNAGDRLIVNGRPFNGTGFAYNAQQAGTARLHTNALLPNWSGIDENTFLTYLFGSDTDPNNPNIALTGLSISNAGPDEDYDAPDFQNMALAALIPSALDLNTIGVVIPSFYRPELFQYQQTASPGQLPRVVMRPMNRPLLGITTATPDFPDLQSDTAGPWDVDNDGDGTRDSIWVNLGFPPKTATNGRQYVPLFAFMILDMDGRLNLNFDGSRSQVQLGINPSDDLPAAAVPMARNQMSSILPKGNGWGPADINLVALFDDPTIVNQQDRDIARKTAYRWLMEGVGGYPDGLPGRYGYNLHPGSPGLVAPFTDPLSNIKFFQFPANYFNFAGPVTSFSTPPDLRCELAFGLDARGAPTYEFPGNSPNDNLTNNPYELSLRAQRGMQPSPIDPVDQLFSPDELERILRFYDIDADQLSPRLLRLFDRANQTVNIDTNNDGITDVTSTFNIHTFTTSQNAPANRRAITTDSYDVPSPGGVASDDHMQNYSPAGTFLPQNIADIFSKRMRAAVTQKMTAANGWTPPLNQNQLDQVESRINLELSRMLAPELFNGLRLDINRPLGNGLDDQDTNGNQNGVVDELEESFLDERFWPTSPTVALDHDNDGVIGGDNDAYLTRVHLARHLYCLAMVLKDTNADIDLDRDGTATNQETAYCIAQWAINAVDFRDADAAMTGFEFDLNPYDGWDVDGFIGVNPNNNQDDAAIPDRGLVWGCERPELLLTETFAIHDRRTEDLQNPDNKTTDLPPDDNFDQRLQPQGGFFVEVYNPWAGISDRTPAELYGFPNSGGVRLNQVSQDGTDTPVWRLMVAQADPMNASTLDRDPDAPPGINGGNPFNVADIERRVYFTPRANLPANLSGESGVHAIGSTQQLQNIAPVMPGRYAVIGTGRYRSGTDYVTPIGRRTLAVDGALQRDGTRQIVLTPNPNANLNQVLVLNNERQDVPTLPPPVSPPLPLPLGIPSEPALTDRQPAVAVVIDSPPLTISEPIGGYPATQIVTADNEGAYNPPLDNPLDFDPADPSPDPYLNQTNTTAGYKVVYLQRLANPLQAYDPDLNPYITIDQMPVNLTTFNGMISNRHDEDTQTNPIILVQDDLPFRTQERGDPADPGNDDIDGRKLWAREAPFNATNSPRETPPVAHNFDQYLVQSLGYLNHSYWHTLNLTAPSPPTPNMSYFDAASAPAPIYVGAPLSAVLNQGSPFPWMTWNNRPYVNQFELLQVPYTSSSRLLANYTLRNGVDPYDDQPGNAPTYNHTFGHLLRFFSSAAGIGQSATHFYRLLEYTEVPSQFLDTDLHLNPLVFEQPPNVSGTRDLHAPFNRVSRYRVPGKININTIYDFRVWENALRQVPPAPTLLPGLPGPSFLDLINSRRGYQLLVPTSPYDMDQNIPTRFANPFRGPGTGSFVPPITTPISPSATLVREDVDTTLARSTADLASPSYDASNANSTPFMFNDTNTPTTAHNDARRNPYFQYHTLQHMGNLVTTRSNVYAVWVTVGFFEVDVHPTTGQLAIGRELGSDLGDVRRHRAFYMIDRTAPVAYEPGQNHNVDRAIMLRRFIE